MQWGFFICISNQWEHVVKNAECHFCVGLGKYNWRQLLVVYNFPACTAALKKQRQYQNHNYTCRKTSSEREDVIFWALYSVYCPNWITNNRLFCSLFAGMFYQLNLKKGVKIKTLSKHLSFDVHRNYKSQNSTCVNYNTRCPCRNWKESISIFLISRFVLFSYNELFNK